MNKADNEQVRISIGRIDILLNLLDRTNKMQIELAKQIANPPAFNFHADGLFITVRSLHSEMRIELDSRTPHFSELYALLMRTLLQAQKERAALLEEQLIMEAVNLRPLTSLKIATLEELALPPELIRPRVIEPFTEEDPS